MNLDEILLRQREDHGDRLQLRQHHDPRPVGCMDHIALVHEPQARASGDRGKDLRVVELHLCALDRRGIGFHRLPGEREARAREHTAIESSQRLAASYEWFARRKGRGVLSKPGHPTVQAARFGGLAEVEVCLLNGLNRRRLLL